MASLFVGVEGERASIWPLTLPFEASSSPETDSGVFSSFGFFSGSLFNFSLVPIPEPSSLGGARQTEYLSVIIDIVVSISIIINSLL